MKLSDTQEAVLAKMETGQWYSAYDLKASLAAGRVGDNGASTE